MPGPPSFRLHATGQWFTHWDGLNRYFGTERQPAHAAYLRSLQDWATWRASKSARPATGAPDAPHPRPLRSARNRTIRELALEWLDVILTDAGPAAHRYYTGSLTRFLAAWGSVHARDVRAPDTHPAAWLNALKADMARQGYAPRTINHDLNAAKRLLSWAGDMGYLPALSMRGARPLRLGERRRIDRPLAGSGGVLAYIAQCEHADPRLGPWLRLHYLAALRPRELVDLINLRGEWEHGGPLFLGHQHSAIQGPTGSTLLPRDPAIGMQGSVYRIRNKVAKATHEHRYLVLPPAALAQLALCGQHWTTGWGYYGAIVRARGEPGGPHFLRHSAASHLRQGGAPLEEIRLALGHWPPGAWQNYVREGWRTPLQIVGRIRLAPAQE